MKVQDGRTCGYCNKWKSSGCFRKGHSTSASLVLEGKTKHVQPSSTVSNINDCFSFLLLASRFSSQIRPISTAQVNHMCNECNEWKSSECFEKGRNQCKSYCKKKEKAKVAHVAELDSG